MASVLLPQLSPIARNSATRASDEVLAVLTEAIRDLTLPPDCPLSETELAARLGVSRTPVREALTRLASAGLVNVLPQVGTRVAAIDVEAVRDAQFVRQHLEIGAFMKACDRGEINNDLLKAALVQQDEAVLAGDVPAFIRADDAFHRAILAAAGHASVWDLVHTNKVHLDRLRALASTPTSLSELLSEHRRIAKHLDEGDPAGAEILRAHLHRPIQRLDELLESRPELLVSGA